METISFIHILFILIISFFLYLIFKNKHGLPSNWPLVGMLPALLAGVHRIYDLVTDILLIAGGTFHFKGPWFSNMTNILLTVDPANIHHIMTSNFLNFPKGSEFKMVFDILGDGIFNSDGDTWRDQRRLTMSLIAHRHFRDYLVQTSMEKVGALISLLDHVSETTEAVVDLQDVFQRYGYDTICQLVTGFDAGSLSTDFPEIPFPNALDDAEEAIFRRHIVPEAVWKLQRWLNVGMERKLSRAHKTFDLVTDKYIEAKMEEMRKHDQVRSDDSQATDLLTSYIQSGYDDKRYLRDTIVNLLLAGRDSTGATLTWFFRSISKRPSILKKIRDEIKSIEATEEINTASINKMIYLHASICESLRLYPAVPWQHKRSAKPDTLPTGHRVDPTVRIMFNLYAMGRMPFIWGDDCLEFRPERWITMNKFGIKHEPSHKFLAFNAGPRTCIGKEMAFVLMKIVAANVVKRFDFEVVEGQDVKPALSIILHMKNGIRAKVMKRDSSSD